MAELKEINVILGKNVRRARNKMNLTREKLAEEINVSPRFLADVESGKTGVSLSTLKNICLVLNISADNLLGITEDDERKIYVDAIESRTRNMSINALKELGIIIDCITNIKDNN